MLSKKYRFHSRGGIKYTYKKGRTIRSPHLGLIFHRNERHRQRFAVVVSKKVDKTAVGRNRIRRRIYEAIRLELPQYSTEMDCVFIVYSKDLATMPFVELQTIIRSLLTRTMV